MLQGIMGLHVEEGFPYVFPFLVVVRLPRTVVVRRTDRHGFGTDVHQTEGDRHGGRSVLWAYFTLLSAPVLR